MHKTISISVTRSNLNVYIIISLVYHIANHAGRANRLSGLSRVVSGTGRPRGAPNVRRGLKICLAVLLHDEILLA